MHGLYNYIFTEFALMRLELSGAKFEEILHWFKEFENYHL
jgi:hypothetical protein